MVLNYEATLNALICTFSSFYCNMYVFVYICMIYIYIYMYTSSRHRTACSVLLVRLPIGAAHVTWLLLGGPGAWGSRDSS